LPLIKGRAIYRTDRKQIVQTPYITNDFIDKSIRPHTVIKAREKTMNAGKPETEGRKTRRYSLIVE
jgi:hypothetical protein